MKSLQAFAAVALLALLSSAQKTVIVPWEIESYRYIEYTDMRARLQNLAVQYPNIMRLESSEDKYGLPHLVNCEEGIR